MSPKLINQLQKLLTTTYATKETKGLFKNRLKNPILTRDEGELEHFCVFFMAIDITSKMVYIGHHRKSNRWIPSGGHIDKDELIEQAAIREIDEEWGFKADFDRFNKPKLLNITDIENPKQWNVCKTHYNIWYFIEVDKNRFKINPKLISKEFYEMKWVNLKDARRLIGNTPSVIEAINLLEKYFKETKR